MTHTFDSTSFTSCVNNAMKKIENYKAQIIDEGYTYNIDTKTCTWAIEQAIINRKPDITMMAAAIIYVESVENIIEKFNGINND